MRHLRIHKNYNVSKMRSSRITIKMKTISFHIACMFLWATLHPPHLFWGLFSNWNIWTGFFTTGNPEEQLRAQTTLTNCFLLIKSSLLLLPEDAPHCKEEERYSDHAVVPFYVSPDYKNARGILKLRQDLSEWPSSSTNPFTAELRWRRGKKKKKKE